VTYDSYIHNDGMMVLSGDIGWETPVYIGCLFGKNQIDFRTQNRKMWDLLGEEGTMLFREWISFTRKRDSMELWRVPSLSYNPAAVKK